MKTKLFLLCSFFCLSLAALEKSTVSNVEYYENPENLRKEKYTTSQYGKILSLLASKEEKIRVMSYNILFNIKEEDQNVENKWPRRLPRLVELIQEVGCDILCVQELYPSQLKDLIPYLEDQFGSVFFQREFGELNAIFYKKERFALLKSHVKWLEEGKYAFISDTVMMAQLEDLKTGKTLAVFNTHLAFALPDVRERQCYAILEQMRLIKEDMSVILTGDLNTFPNTPEENLPLYDGDYIASLLKGDGLRDAKEIALLGHFGPLSTFTNAQDSIEPFRGTGTPGVFLDHIFVSKGIEVLVHAVESGKVEGHFPSDHMPVFIDLIRK